MFFPGSAQWRTCCVVSLLLLAGSHFGTHDQKSSSAYSCQVVPAVHTTRGSYVWVRTPESPQKAESVRKEPSLSNFKSELGTSHHISGSTPSSLGQSVCALNAKTKTHPRKKDLEAWRLLQLLSATALLPVAFTHPTGHHPLDLKWSGEHSSSFLAVTAMLLCHELNISGI